MGEVSVETETGRKYVGCLKLSQMTSVVMSVPVNHLVGTLTQISP